MRVIQLGLTLDDLDNLEYGFVYEMMIESQNDGEEYYELADQEDFNRF